MHSSARRLKGLALLLLALGPPVVIIAGLVVTATLAVGVVRITGEKVRDATDTVNQQILPRIEAIKDTYTGLAENTRRLRAGFEQVTLTLGGIKDLRIDPGQLGATGPRRIQVPANPVSVGVGLAQFTVESGRLFDQTLPAVQIPDRPVTIPVGPLREAFAPLGPEGVLGRAVQATRQELDRAVDEVTKLREPADGLLKAMSGWFEPVRATAVLFAWALAAMVAAFVLLILSYVVAGIYLAVRRSGEAAAAYQSGGEIGYVLYVHRTLVIEGYRRLFRRETAWTRPPSTVELYRTIEQLKLEMADLRARTAAPWHAERVPAE